MLYCITKYYGLQEECTMLLNCYVDEINQIFVVGETTNVTLLFIITCISTAEQKTTHNALEELPVGRCISAMITHNVDVSKLSVHLCIADCVRNLL